MALYLGDKLINGVFTNYSTTTINTSDATAAADKILEGYTAYINGTKVTGTFKPAANLIKKDAVIAGVTGTFTSDATATSPEHIRVGYSAYANGVKISGAYSGLDTSDATATTSDHVREGYTAYSKGVKIIGTYSGIDTTLSNGATAAQILTGRSAYVNNNLVNGQMPNNGAVTPSALGAGGSYTIPAGYHNGSGKVTVQSLATMTSAGTVTSNSQILSGYKAYSDGTLYTGSMANNGAVSATLAANGSYIIPAGYHNGSGKVTQNLPTQGADTFYPSSSTRTIISAGTYCTGAIKIGPNSGVALDWGFFNPYDVDNLDIRGIGVYPDNFILMRVSGATHDYLNGDGATYYSTPYYIAYIDGYGYGAIAQPDSSVDDMSYHLSSFDQSDTDLDSIISDFNVGSDYIDLYFRVSSIKTSFDTTDDWIWIAWED